MRAMSNVVVLGGLILAFSATGRAQQPPTASAPAQPPVRQAPTRPSEPPREALPVIPLKVDVVIVKYQGDRKVSSTPYAFSVNTNSGKASIRMGAQVPIPMSGTVPKSPDGPPVVQPMQYKSIGTNIDCFAQTAADGRYRVNVSIEDTSVYPSSPDVPLAVAGAPTLRTFRASNELMLKDGQTREFMAATDKVSGEIIKAEVTLTVLQ